MDKNIKTEILSISSDLSEVALDSLLSDGLFKDIPVISTIISFRNLAKSAVDILLLTRILSFVNALGIKSQKEIDDLKEKYFKDKDYKRIGSKILFSLEKVDDETKVQWLATSFRKYLDKKMNTIEFLKISSIINNGFVNDIEQIIIFKESAQITSKNEFIDSCVLDHLYSIGLLENIGFDGGNPSGKNSGTILRPNQFGNIFLKEII